MWGMFRPFHQAFATDEETQKKLKDTFVTPDAAQSRDGLFHTLFWKVLTAANQGEMQLRYVNGTDESYASHQFSHTFILIAWAFYQVNRIGRRILKTNATNFQFTISSTS